MSRCRQRRDLPWRCPRVPTGSGCVDRRLPDEAQWRDSIGLWEWSVEALGVDLRAAAGGTERPSNPGAHGASPKHTVTIAADGVDGHAVGAGEVGDPANSPRQTTRVVRGDAHGPDIAARCPVRAGTRRPMQVARRQLDLRAEAQHGREEERTSRSSPSRFLTRCGRRQHPAERISDHAIPEHWSRVERSASARRGVSQSGTCAPGCRGRGTAGARGRSPCLREPTPACEYENRQQQVLVATADHPRR